MSTLDDLSAAILAFQNEFKDKAEDKFTTRSNSVDSTHLTGMEPLAFIDYLQTNLRNHLLDLTPDAHNDTLSAIGMPTKAVVETKLESVIKGGQIPVSSVGSEGFLPINVSGSFEGATLVKNTASGPVNNREMAYVEVEQDGTLTSIYNGTNGSIQGVYYATLENIQNPPQTRNIRQTGFRFKPSILGVNEEVPYINQGGNGFIAGMVNVDGVADRCFISMTGGTLDTSSHRTIYLPLSFEPYLNQGEVIRCGDTIFIVSVVEYNKSTNSSVSMPFTLEIHQFPLSAFDTVGSTVTPTTYQVTKCVGFLGAEFTPAAGTLQFATRVSSSEKNDGPSVSSLFYHRLRAATPASGYFAVTRSEGGSGRAITTSAANEDGTAFRSLFYVSFRGSLSSGLQWGSVCFNFTIDLTTGIAAIDERITDRIEIDTANGTALAYSGYSYSNTSTSRYPSFYKIGTADRMCCPQLRGDRLMITSMVVYTPHTRSQFSVSRHTLTLDQFSRLKYPLMDDNYHVTANNYLLGGMYGSAIGSSIIQPTFISNNRFLVICEGGMGDQYTDINVVRVEANVANPTEYTFKSIMYDEMQGIAPTTARQSLYRFDAANPQATGPSSKISRILKSGTDARASWFRCYMSTLDQVYPVPHIVNVDGKTLDGTVSVNNGTVRQKIIDYEIDIAQQVGWIPVETITVDKIVYELIMHDVPGLPAIYSTAILFNGKYVAQTCRAVNLVKNGAGVVVDVEPIYNFYNYRDTINNNTPESISLSILPITHNAMWVWEADEGWVISLLTSARVVYTGGYKNGYGLNCFYDKTTNAFSGVTHYSQPQAAAIPIAARICMPGEGFGIWNNVDYYCKGIFTRIAKTKAEYMAWFNAGASGPTVTASNSLVVISQDVAEGWNVYFTEETPLILDGNRYTLPISSFDLSTLPVYQNTTLYVYARVINDEPEWFISADMMPDSEISMFVGTISTDSNQITSIQLEKVKRLGNYRLSTTPAGQAIAVSSGLPHDTAKLLW